MSKINDLINKLCPNGVEFKFLKDVFELFSGMTGVSNKWADEGNCQFIDYMNAYKNNKIDITKLPYATVKNLKQTTLIQGDLLLTSASEVPDECAIASVIEDEIQDGIFMDDHLFGLRLKDKYKDLINTTFVAYYLNSKPFRCNLFKAVRGVTRFYISNNNYMKLLVPLPPIEVQEEIVRILDKFGELEAELEAELEVRKSQYEFWRGKLLDKKYKKMKLQDVLSIKNGKDYKHLENGNVPVYGSGGIMTYVNDYVYNKPTVLIPRKGSLGNVFTPFWNVDTIYYTEIDETKVIPKYIYYFIQNQHLDKLNIAGGVPSMTQATLNKIDIDVPSIDEQRKIVSILDKFDKLVNDISLGIPAEIELRRQQYEYYRNKLLSFEELSVSE